MEDALSNLGKKTGRAPDRVDRLEATHAADAKKARQIVRQNFTSLMLLARAIAQVTGDVKVKHGLEGAVERFSTACRVYMKEELKPDGRVIEWMGVGHGVMPRLPDGAPEHKVELAEAWNDMLAKVNEATKVGVHKKHQNLPISLISEVDDYIWG